MSERLIVIGGGQAASTVVTSMRGFGDTRPITVISEETDPPYQRPPLSKGYLQGKVPEDRLLLRPAAWYREHDVVLHLERRVTDIDRDHRRVTLNDGEQLDYGALVLATGATPRRLPAAIGGELDGVYVLRSRADADAIRRRLGQARNLLVIGGGYIGLEVAASVAGSGCRVVVVEMADRILQRVAAPETSDFFRDVHRAHGVDIRESTGLVRLLGEDGRVHGAELDDGTVCDAEVVVVGIGVRPNDDLAQKAGLDTDDGILVDERCRSSDPAILAAGDCARFWLDGRRIRLESVQNANDQARAAARTLCGRETAYHPVPWFWSDQFDVRLKIAGFSAGYDEVVTRPGRAAGSLSVWYYREGRLIAVDSLTDAASHTIARKLLAAGHSPPPSRVRDPGLELKTLLA